MKWAVQALLPNRISGQIAILMLASVIVIHGVLATAFFLSRPDLPKAHLPDQLETLIRLIDATPPATRSVLLADIANAFPSLELASAVTVPGVAERPIENTELAEFARHLGPDYAVARVVTRSLGSGVVGVPIAIRLRDGEFVTARLFPMQSPLFGPLTMTLLVTAVSITALVLWATRGLTSPLRRFAWAAENFSPSGEIAPLPERGPYEIRTASRALNRMRQRIKSLIDDRTRMLAAVSHDLRTPITRLRLRCEFIEDETARAKMLEELAHMNAMVESVLHFLRDGEAGEEAIMLDLATALQAICDQFADTGHDVSYHGPDHVVVRAHAEELHRALTNLIDNAVRHGGKTDVRVTLAPPTVTVAIEDDGPGIPDPHKQAMFEPFVRGDTARGMNDQTGFGLGLSIARAVIEAHHGTLMLLDREPRGLVAKVTLPCAGANGAEDAAARPSAFPDHLLSLPAPAAAATGRPRSCRRR